MPSNTLPTITMWNYVLLLAALILPCIASFVNVNVKRVVDVTSTVAISRATIRMKNIGGSPASSFYLSVKSSDTKTLGDIWVTDSSTQPPTALRMEHSTKVPGLKPCCKGFRVELKKPVPVGAEVTVDVRMDVLDVVKPVPEVIDKHQEQFMRYFGNSYFFSPYKTEEMTTSVTLGSSTVTSKHGLVEPFKLDGKKLVMGPYKDVEPLSYNEITVRFKNDRGFLVATRAVKEFYVNHLSNIAVKEEFKVTNAGARHQGEWSRVDHASGHASKYSAALDDVWANLPEDATRVNYEDLIGNITTSKLRKPTKGKRALQLVFRYPLMGGWQNHFWITYELVLSKYLSSKGSEHVLKVPLVPSLNTDLLCKEYEVKIYLPEWSSNVEVRPHPSLRLTSKMAAERTTLTIYGRPTIAIGAQMMRSQSKHAKTLVVTYTYNPLFAYFIPALVSIQLLSFFIGFALCARRGLGIGAEELGTASDKVKTQ